jgi:hypothetical protein
MGISYVVILLICIPGGLIFAYIAYKTVKEAGNSLGSGETKIKIAGPVEISTGSAAVALFIFAVLFGAGVPLYVAYEDFNTNDAPISLEGRFNPPQGQVFIASLDYGSHQVLEFPVFRSQTPQHFQLTPDPQYNKVELDATYVPLNHEFSIMLLPNNPGNPGPLAATVNGNSANLPADIVLTKAVIKGVETQRDLVVKRAKVPITKSDLQFPDPTNVETSSGVTQQ